MTTQTEQDTAIKQTIDQLAKKYGYPEGTLDSEKGTLTYDVSTPEFGFPEALKRVTFRMSIYDVLKGLDMKVTAHYKELRITLPNW